MCPHLIVFQPTAFAQLVDLSARPVVQLFLFQEKMASQETAHIVPHLGSVMTDTGLERFEFTIGDDVIPYFLGHDCFDGIAAEIVKIGQQRAYDKLFIGCDETIE